MPTAGDKVLASVDFEVKVAMPMTAKIFYDRQIKEYSTLITNDIEDPEYAKHLHYLARAMIELDDLNQSDSYFEDIIDLLDTAIEHEEDDYHQMWNYQLRARAYNKREIYYEDAIMDADEGLKLHDNPSGQMWLYHVRAQAYKGLGGLDNLKQALNDIEKAISIDPIEYKHYEVKEDINNRIEAL